MAYEPKRSVDANKMSVVYRRPHVRGVPEHPGETFSPRETTRPMIRQLQGGGFRAVYPPSMNREQVFRQAPYRYTMVRGHLVRVIQPLGRNLKTVARKQRLVKQQNALRAARGNKCEICETPADYQIDPRTGGLEWAHVAETELSGMGRGRSERVSDISTNPEKYALMCVPCHRRFDEVLGPVPHREQRYVRTGVV